MRILYDSQIFDSQVVGGISRYHYELIKNNRDDEVILSTKFTDNEYLLHDDKYNFKSDPYTFEKFLPGLNFRGKHFLFRTKNKINPPPFISNKEETIKLLKDGNFDVFHPTYYDPYFLDYMGNKPYVVTIHDLIYEKYPELYPLNARIRENKKVIIENANKIIAISECTKKDIIEFYGVNEDKISVIYHGLSFKQNENVQLKPKFNEIIQKKYFLFTGLRTLYKNFYFMVYALCDFLKEHKDVNIVCTSWDFSEEEIGLFKELGIENQIIHYFASDDELFLLYKKALAFIFPSYYEGFGIPILEAFQAECPLILAKASCFPEIAKDAALYFDSKNSYELKDCCKKILESEDLRKKYIKKGLERVKDFSWERTTKETQKVYESIK
jgi:glycosyltransferase involved in cell wall biosynthesis